MKKLTANWGLKLASLLFAVIVWFLVTNINDPITSVRYTNIPVTIKNGNLITDKGQVYTVLDGSDTISSVVIYAPRAVIDSLSPSNIVATADVQNLSSFNTVKIDITTNKYSDKIDNYVPSSDMVKLNIERKASKSLVLSASTSGTVSDGYVIGDVTTEQNMVRISGPESFVNNVAKAAVDVDVTGFTSNIGTDADIVLYDYEGNALDIAQSGVTMNIRTVRVNIQILETKYVPIKYNIKGEPASGYALTGQIDSTPQEVLIAGRSSVISSISELTVNDDSLDVSGMTGNLTRSIDLSESLPTGVSFGDDDFNGTASVVVYIGPLVEETYEISTRKISIEGSVEGFDIYIDENEYNQVSLTLVGLRTNINAIKESDIAGIVKASDLAGNNNVDELTPGIYNGYIEWNLPDNVYAKTAVSVYVTVEEKE